MAAGLRAAASVLLAAAIVSGCAKATTPATPEPTPTATAGPMVRVELATPTPEPALPRTYHDLAIDPGNPADMWLTYGPALLHSLDSGVTWSEEVGAATGGPIQYAAAFPAADAFYTAGQGVVRVSRDGGASWAPVAEIGDAEANGLSADPADSDTLFAMLHDRGLMASSDAGGTWSLISSGLPPSIFGVWPVRADPLRLVSVDRATFAVYASDDRGVTWDPLQARGLEGDLQGVDLGHDGTAYAVTTQGLYASIDGGDTWEERGDRGPLAAVAVSPADPATVFVVDDRGSVYKSLDGGRTW